MGNKQGDLALMEAIGRFVLPLQATLNGVQAPNRSGKSTMLARGPLGDASCAWLRRPPFEGSPTVSKVGQILFVNQHKVPAFFVVPRLCMRLEPRELN